MLRDRVRLQMLSMFECWLESLRQTLDLVQTRLRRRRSALISRAFPRLELLESRQLLSADGLQLQENSGTSIATVSSYDDGSSADVADPDANTDSNDNTDDSDDSANQVGSGAATTDDGLEIDALMRTAALISPRILNGTPIDSSDFPAVGITGDRREPSGFGTGTLIAPQWVLTAGHVSRGVGARAGIFILDGVTYHTIRVIKYPKFRYSKLGTDKGNDISLWELATPVVGVTPSQIGRTAPQVGDELTLVGYGSGGNDAGEFGDFGTKREGSTPIDAVSSTLISWNFDQPGESNTGHGDSGGPAFVTHDGVTTIAGITSGGQKSNSAFGDHSFDTRVDVFARWIDSKVSKFSRTLSTERNANASSAADQSTRSDFNSKSAGTADARVFDPRIINGTPIPDATFPTVGEANSQLGQCTATLIAPQWILTAGHCSQGIGPTDGTFVLNGQTYHSTLVVVNSKYKVGKLGTDSANDIALWKLDRVVPDITPSPLLRKAPKVGQMLTLVGYGLGGDANGETGQYGTKRQGQTSIDGVSAKLLHWNFDVPTESDTAGGDSGGPAFVLVGGTYYLAGVTSGGTSSTAALGDHAVDTRVDRYAKWIDKTISGNLRRQK
jgi:secreted trypsin-like serine protease